MLPTQGGPLMSILPGAARPLLHAFAGAFTPPTFKRFFILMLGAVLTTGRRTITNLLRAVGGLAPGHPSSYHRVFSRRRWSLWTLGHALADFILRRWVPQGSVPLVGDDTVDEHRGAKVYGKSRHRDPVRSTRSYTAYRWDASPEGWFGSAIPSGLSSAEPPREQVLSS